MSENKFLEVGTNEAHEVVINLPPGETGHIVFSIEQARQLAETLRRQANVAAATKDDEEEERRRASIPPVDRSNLCTTNGQPVADVLASQTNETGQHAGYIVLCDAERAKGFVRPYRDSYRHVGKMIELVDDAGNSSGHPNVGGCGTVTTMGRALSETYARDPKFYGSTFCVRL
jgi:hypothetical protein